MAREWGEIYVKNWEVKNSRNRRLLELNIFPFIGHLPIGEIKPKELREALYVARDKGILESAHRSLKLCSRIYRYAILNEYCLSDITIPLDGVLPPKNPKHYASITEPKEIGKLLQSIDQYDGSFIVKTALQLAPLVFVRPLELRSCKWADVSFNTAEWRFLITKTKTQHIVPLSRQSISLLESLRPITGHGIYVFPSNRTLAKGDRCISENSLNSALRRMDYSKEKICAHGFRAMARTLLDEELKFRPDYIEHQLAHSVRDPNGRAYNRTTHLAERKVMMKKWADYLDDLKDTKTMAK